jgi:hypothetical protein
MTFLSVYISHTVVRFLPSDPRQSAVAFAFRSPDHQITRDHPISWLGFPQLSFISISQKAVSALPRRPQFSVGLSVGGCLREWLFP